MPVVVEALKLGFKKPECMYVCMVEALKLGFKKPECMYVCLYVCMHLRVYVYVCVCDEEVLVI